MIIWINGAYGSGKTTSACELSRRLPDSFVYDPENTGFFIRENTPSILHEANFQDHDLWRRFNYEMLKFISDSYDGIIIAPMTIYNRRYYDEIIGRLINDGITVKHFILYAEHKTIEKRLNKRLSRGDTWAKSKIDPCIRAFNNDITEEKIITDDMSISMVVEEIAFRSGISLVPDNRSPLKKFINRTITLLTHIRR